MKGVGNTDGWPLDAILEHRSIPEPNSGCRLWLAFLNATGYGQIRYKKRAYQAHRLAWIAKHGPIPEGLQVLHKCDVRSCINPDHLWLGTQADNIHDMIAKGRRGRRSA